MIICRQREREEESEVNVPRGRDPVMSLVSSGTDSHSVERISSIVSGQPSGTLLDTEMRGNNNVRRGARGDW